MSSKILLVTLVATLLASATNADQNVADLIKTILDTTIQTGFKDLATPKQSFRNFLKAYREGLEEYLATLTFESNTAGRIIGSTGLEQASEEIVRVIGCALNNFRGNVDESFKHWLTKYYEIFVTALKNWAQDPLLKNPPHAEENKAFIEAFTIKEKWYKTALENVDQESVETAIGQFIVQGLQVYEDIRTILKPFE